MMPVNGLSVRVAAGPDVLALGVGEEAAPFRDLVRYAEAEGVQLERVKDASAALRALGEKAWAMILVALDAGKPDEQLSWWTEILSRVPRRPRLIALAPTPSIGLSLRAAQLGVFDVLSLPLAREPFHEMLQRVREVQDETTVPLPDAQPAEPGGFPMVSESPAMLPVFRTVAQVAPSTTTVLVMGESGTGKELVARAIHGHGPRAAQPFVAINCAAIPENLLESELFGHDKGAFTGAVARKIGRFERANGGTLFMDEIGDMSLALQSKILRAVQEREIERVGGVESIPVDVRLIAATNRDLKALMSEGRFREDLYFRLAVVTIRLPRLAERGDDLLLLCSAFLKEFGAKQGKTFESITEQALELLRRHEWLGNVRELRNVVERAALVSPGGVLRAAHLPEEWRTGGDLAVEPEVRTLSTLLEMEARHIARVLAHTRGQIGEAARILGVHRNTLARKIKEYGL